MISIIVPVYNCEQYLPKCLDSLIHQTYQNVEILLIDDGSTDSSTSMCDEYACNNSKVKVIHKENGGVSSARNAGIQAATGDYIMFVDSDDWLELDACEKIAAALHSGIQLYFWASYIDETTFLPITARESIDKVASDIIACNGKDQNGYIRAVWAKVFASKLAKRAAFPEDFYIGEDACFLLNCLQQITDIRQIMFVNQGWYHYRIVANSAVRKYKPDLLEQSIKQYEYIFHYTEIASLETNPNIIAAMTMFCWQVFISLKMNSLKRDRLPSQDCAKWAKIAETHLRNTKIHIGHLSKLQLLCRMLYRFGGEKMAEKVIEPILNLKGT